MQLRHPVGIHLSDMFPIKKCFNKEDVLSPVLLNFASVYAVRRVQVNHDSLKLNGTQQLLVYDDILICWVEAFVLLRKYLLVSKLD